ncbi:MAG: hypothetical protein J5531_02995 [Lachnospiraceae bacterium]|nr:hypothetical protein [Lachnospiraceae bacterium]
MIKTMNQSELMSVNGGYYCVPVYNVIRYYVNGFFRGQDKKCVGMQRVEDGSGITEICHYTNRYFYD